MGGNASTLAHRALVLSGSWRGKNARLRHRVAGIFMGALLAAAPVVAGTAHEGYDLIFRTGTLAEFAPGDALQYQ
ncbi:MAG: hypothetical protein H5U14_13860, partial [Roseovarius sp.]|nr:hypothetical protein [Roseovarius sp.]